MIYGNFYCNDSKKLLFETYLSFLVCSKIRHSLIFYSKKIVTKQKKVLKYMQIENLLNSCFLLYKFK